MKNVLKWTAIGCGGLSVLLLVIFAVLIAIEMNGNGITRRLGGTPTPAVASKPAAATPSPQPTAAAADGRLGQTTTLTAPSGLNVAITVNAVQDPATGTNQFNKPKGRFVVVDWTIKNNGQQDQQINATWFKVQTADSYLVDRANNAGLPEPDLTTSTIGPGQTVRGFLAYDVPAGQQIKAAVFQAPGSRQFVIAALSQ